VRALVVVALLFAGCAARSRDARSASESLPRRWHYALSVDAELSKVDATICFDGPSARELRAGKDEAATQLVQARWLSPGSVHRLPVVDGKIQLDPDVDNACVAYSVALTENGNMDASVRRVGRDVLASPNAWLWRPQRRAADSEATLRMALPAGVRASVPWPQKGGDYVLSSDAFGFDSYAAFGRFQPFAVSHGGATLNVAVLDGALAIDPAGISRWLARTVDIVSGANGVFPIARGQILIVPASASSDPIHFGTVARGGAGSVILFMSANADEASLMRDWVLPHELSHLFLPFVSREQAWFPEGLATYYQEVLLARAGAFSEQATLRNLWQALASAREEGTGRTLGDESTAMYDTYAFRAVYWGGAAYFLLADVALRQKSQGKQSLDTVVSELRKRPDHNSKTWTADELTAELDRLAGMSLFVPLAEESLRRPFPDYEPTLEAMGVRDGGKRLDDGAPLAGIRRAIFGKR